jgi:hypothetical protein
MSNFALLYYEPLEGIKMQELKILCLEIESKVLRWAEIYNDLKIENERVKNRNKELRDRMSVLEKKVKSQAAEVVRYKLGKAASNQDSNTDVKLKINELIREIDVCIKLLNE